MNRRLPARLLRAAALAAAYVATARLSALSAPPEAGAAALWAPAGVALAGLILLGPGYWPAVAVGTFATVVSLGAPPIPAAIASVLRALTWAAAAWLLTRRLHMRHALPRVPDVLAFAMVGGGAALMVGATGWLMVGGRLGGAPGATRLASWAAGTLAGVLVVAPFVLAWSRREGPRPRGHAWELPAVLLLGAAVADSLFWPQLHGAAQLPLTYLVFPLVGWASLRLGTRAAASLTLVIAAVAMVRVTGGVPAVFQRESPSDALLALQAYLSLVAVSGLLLAALTRDRNRALARERRARREAERVGRRQTFMVEACALISGTLDYSQTLSSLARVCVPSMGDGCIVDEIRDDGSPGTIVTLHRDPDTAAALADLRGRYPLDANPHSAIAAVRRSGRALLVRDAGDEFVRRLAVNAEHEALLRRLRLRSAIFAPMVAGDRVEGVLTLLRTGTGPPYGDADLALALEMAGRAALHVQNARLYHAARAAAVVRQRVISMVSHEMRSPLAAILLNAGALMDGTLPTAGEAGHKPLRSIVVAADQVERLIRDLADVTRLEGGGDFPVGREPFSPAALLREARLLLEPLTASAGVHAEWVAEGEPGTVVGDRERTLQVLSNLVSNARRHTLPGGHVRVQVAEVEGEVRFSVSDTGDGMEPDRLEALLAPLWSEAPHPRGLGLPLSRAIVAAQGGRMWGESRPGEGSRFYFTLPLAAPGAASAGILHSAFPPADAGLNQSR
ncbi:MAG: MASE1 domain-containing protein [Longimicrobiaceae bacterium]